MSPKDVWEYYGNAYRFQKKTGMGANSLRGWIKKGYIPEGSQLKLEYLTNAKLKAEPREKSFEYKESNQAEGHPA